MLTYLKDSPSMLLRFEMLQLGHTDGTLTHQLGGSPLRLSLSLSILRWATLRRSLTRAESGGHCGTAVTRLHYPSQYPQSWGLSPCMGGWVVLG